MLREVKIKEVYNSEDDNILEDFYIPALQNSILYDRAVGYFDAKVLTAAARGLACFVDNGGKIRLIVGATLMEEEYEAIARGYNEREIKEKLGQQLSDSIDKYEGNLFDNQLNTLSWFIENNRLDIKIALRRGGIYHEKIGVMTDENGDSVVFQGSANETRNALSPYNYESINVFKSWLSEFSGHITPHVKKFETLWNDNARNTKVLNFTDITKSILASRQNGVLRPSLSREIELWQKELKVESPVVNFKKGPHVPEMLNGRRFRLRRHQRDALNSWKKNNFRGIFELATGAGKTITAIYGAVKLYESRKRLFLVISAPYQSLADQWSDNLRLFNISPIVCYGGEAKWVSTLTKKIVDFEAKLIDFVAIIVVDATLSSNSRTFFNSISTLEKEHSDHFLFVGDECHHHGASITAESLPENASMRMGLSATPDRGDEDQEGNNNLSRYYGDCIASYTLKDALDDDVLTPYEYHLIEVSLSSDEAEEYISLSKKISRLIAVGKSVNGKINPNALNVLLSKRARLINGTKNKPIALKELIKNMKPIKHSLFYCAEGKLGDDDQNDDDEAIKQIEIISRVLHEMGWKSSQFTAKENKEQRNSILETFKTNGIDSLVAMKCLDEGIDVPACSTAFILASSRKPRQFIQRRGRILRKSKGKEKAVIYDFFVTLPVSATGDDGIERRLMIAELKRINEFANLALNKGETYNKLETYLKQHDLTHYVT